MQLPELEQQRVQRQWPVWHAIMKAGAVRLPLTPDAIRAAAPKARAAPAAPERKESFDLTWTPGPGPGPGAGSGSGELVCE